MRKAFQVLIYNKLYDVYRIEGKEHQGLNGTDKDLWIYYAPRLRSDLFPPKDSDDLKPYSVGIKRLVWDIHFKQQNTTKEKWGETQFNNNISCTILCNGKPFYSFGTFDMAFAFAKAQYLMVALAEHSFNFFDPETQNGRKIYWYGLPATVKVKGNSWEIGIVPDYTNYPKEEWWKELRRRETPMDKEWVEMRKEEYSESMASDYINWGDAFSDQHIGWFRKDGDIKP